MQKQIELLNTTVEYTLRASKRARRCSFTIYSGGEFVVTVPVRANQDYVERLLREKSEWIVRTLTKSKKLPPRVKAPRRNTRREYALHKVAALALAKKRLEHWNRHYNFKYNIVRIRNQKSRWGSCSRNGNLSFSYKIALMPREVADYIIVHELCHLGEFNHSRAFWSLVSRTIPNYRTLRHSLKSPQF